MPMQNLIGHGLAIGEGRLKDRRGRKYRSDLFGFCVAIAIADNETEDVICLVKMLFDAFDSTTGLPQPGRR